MIKQVIVAHLVHATMIEQRVDMLVELLTDQKVMVEFLQELMLLVGEEAGISRVDGWEMTTKQ